MRLGERLTAARRDAQIRGAEAFMADELDDAHLLAEHRAACDEIKRLRTLIRTDWALTPDLLERLADARTDYIHDDGPWREAITAEVSMLRTLAKVLDGKLSVDALVGSLAPTWRMQEFPEVHTR